MIDFIPLTFFGLIAVVGIAFFMHGFLNRQKIFVFFREFAQKLNGESGRDHFAAYPWLKGIWNGRVVRIFFHTSENHTVSVLNLVTEMEFKSPLRFILLQKDGFRKPKPDQLQKLEEEVGPILSVEGIPFDVRSPDNIPLSSILANPDFQRALSDFSAYNQILFWDGRVMASRQFDGVPEVTPERLSHLVEALSHLVRPLEAEAVVGVS